MEIRLFLRFGGELMVPDEIIKQFRRNNPKSDSLNKPNCPKEAQAQRACYVDSLTHKTELDIEYM